MAISKAEIGINIVVKDKDTKRKEKNRKYTERFGRRSALSVRLDTMLDSMGFSMKTKLIIIFLVVKVIPLIILALLAWFQLTSLGNTLRGISVNDSTEALNDSATENIERITTDTANQIANFLYNRDDDIEYISKIEPTEENFKTFAETKQKSVVNRGEWKLSDDGMSWESLTPEELGEDSKSTNKENNDTVNGGSYHYIPSITMSSTTIPLYDEITYIDLEGNEVVKYVSPNSSKVNYPINPEPANIADGKNTYVSSENYFSKLKELQPGDIYVSDVIGAYTPSHFIGMYTPKQMVISALNAEATALTTTEDMPEGASDLAAALTDIKEKKIPKLDVQATDYEGMMKEVSESALSLIDNATKETNDEVLTERLAALKTKIQNLKFEPEKEAYAGEENPLGQRFEGIVRWATPVTDDNGEITGYVSFALNQDHIMEFVDHITPMKERYVQTPSAYLGNYAFIWDYQCRSIAHPRHHSIVGYDPELGVEQIPWLDTATFDKLMAESGSTDLESFKKAWPDLLSNDDSNHAGGVDNMIKGVTVFDNQSRTKKPAPILTANGYVGLDGRYLNNAPQCTGWMDLTKEGGSGSFYILWSGLYKLTTAAAIPYYTGQYAPSEDNEFSKRGFAMVTIGAGLEDFTAPARTTEKNLQSAINSSMLDTTLQLFITTVILILLVVFVAIWLAGFLSNSITGLIIGINRFRAGERQFRFNSKVNDEFGTLADAFDEMAEGIVDSVKNPLIITDNDMKIIYVNDASLNLMGLEEKDMIGKNYFDITVFPKDSESDPIKAHFEGRDFADIYYYKDKDMYIQGTSAPFFDSDGNRIGFLVRVNDMTEIVNKQIDLENAVYAANVANEHKSNFLARMSHEIRTPMNAIIGLTGIVKKHLERTEDAIEAGELADMSDVLMDIEHIETSSQHLLGLLNDILDISKIEAGKIEFNDTIMEIRDLEETVVEIIEPRCREKNISLVTNFGEFDRSAFLCDSLRLRQVLINILGNAVKFTPELGRIVFTIEQKEVHDNMTLIHFSVKDNGIGIDDEVKESIFEPFKQADQQTTRRYGGTGLGLAISQRIVNLLGGDIKLESCLGEGSEFSFELWLKQAKTEALDEVEIGDYKDKLKGKRMLLVDDVEINRIIVISLLEDTGIEIDEAENGQEALDMFRDAKDNTYDIVLMDVQMPIMDGYEASMAIRDLDKVDAKSVPIVALTANAFKDDIDKALESGMNGHIAKPVEMDKMLQVLFSVMPQQ